MAYIPDEEYERLARALRSDVGVEDFFCPDLIFVLNALQEKRQITEWQVTSDNVIAGKAHYDSDTKTVTLSKSTFAALDKAFVSKIDRRSAKFTVAHELGHYVRGHEGLYYRSNSSLLGTPPSRLRVSETDANLFAAALLVPFYLVQRAAKGGDIARLSIEDISDIFDVSYSVARYRKPVLERIDRRRKGEGRLLPEKFAEFLRQLQAQGHRLDSLEIDDARRDKIAKQKKNEE